MLNYDVILQKDDYYKIKNCLFIDVNCKKGILTTKQYYNPSNKKYKNDSISHIVMQLCLAKYAITTRIPCSAHDPTTICLAALAQRQEYVYMIYLYLYVSSECIEVDLVAA